MFIIGIMAGLASIREMAALNGNWSRRQRYHVGGEISGRVGEILGRVIEIFWTRRRNPWTRRRNIVDSSAAFWSPRQHKNGRLGKDTASATRFLDASAYNIYRLGT